MPWSNGCKIYYVLRWDNISWVVNQDKYIPLTVDVLLVADFFPLRCCCCCSVADALVRLYARVAQFIYIWASPVLNALVALFALPPSLAQAGVRLWLRNLYYYYALQISNWWFLFNKLLINRIEVLLKWHRLPEMLVMLVLILLQSIEICTISFDQNSAHLFAGSMFLWAVRTAYRLVAERTLVQRFPCSRVLIALAGVWLLDPVGILGARSVFAALELLAIHAVVTAPAIITAERVT